MGTPRQFSIIGGTVWGNRGAEAMVCTVVGLLQRNWPDTRFHVFSYFPAEDRQRVRRPGVTICDSTPAALVLRLLPGSLACFAAALFGARVPDRWLPAEVVALRSSTALLDVSGISFADGREKFLPFNILCLLPAILLGVPVVKLSQALGPFRGAMNRFAAQLVLARCRKIFARGVTSADHLVTLQLDESRRGKAADIAFLFEDVFSLSEEGSSAAEAVVASLPAGPERTTRIIGVCPSSVVLSQAERAGVDYIGALASLIVGLARRGDTVVVLPNATRAGTKTLRNNDIPVIESVRQRCASSLTDIEQSRIRWMTADFNTASLRRVIAALDVLVTSRFHAMIGALALRVPTVVLGWSHKYREVLQAFGLEEYCFGFRESDAAQILDAIEQLLAPDARRSWLAGGNLERARDSSQAQFAYVLREFA